MYKNTKKALEIILKEEYDKENPLQSFTHLNLGNQLLTVPKGETILYQGDSAEYFYFLLSGHTVIRFLSVQMISSTMLSRHIFWD